MLPLRRVFAKFVGTFLEWTLILGCCLLIWKISQIQLRTPQQIPVLQQSQSISRYINKGNFKENPDSISCCFYSETSKYVFHFPNRTYLIPLAFFPNETHFLKQHENIFNGSSSAGKIFSNYDFEWNGNAYPYIPTVPLRAPKEIPLKPLCSFLKKISSWDTIGLKYVKDGGKYSPTACIARFNVAVIIPYRGRPEHLETLLNELHPFLQRQQLSYTIFVTEQNGSFQYFNKGILLNAAFLLTVNYYNDLLPKPFDCYIFHDVDLVPLDDHNYYYCTKSNPRHLSVAVDSLNNSLPYSCLIGGVLSISPEQYIQVNGFSNYYWKWGGEDDDFYNRLAINGIRVMRPESTIAKYKMLQHGRRIFEQNGSTSELLLKSSKKRFTIDGLSTVRFRLFRYLKAELYTHYIIDIGEPLSLSAAEEFVIATNNLNNSTDEYEDEYWPTDAEDVVPDLDAYKDVEI